MAVLFSIGALGVSGVGILYTIKGRRYSKWYTSADYLVKYYTNITIYFIIK